MAKFYNPYHFVPVTGEGSTVDLPKSDFISGERGHVRHDRYMVRINEKGQIEDGFSGRCICRLTTEDPVVVGNKQEKPAPDEPTTIYPFELEKDTPAIPASSLKGLISSITEAASNSALRVLEDKALSYRVSMNEEPLSAIGMIVEVNGEDDNNKWWLLPLALPTMQKDRQGAVVLPFNYRKMFPEHINPPPLKLYIGERNQIRNGSFIGNLPCRAYSLDQPDYCYAKLHPRSWRASHLLPIDQWQHFSRNQRYLLSQETVDKSPPIPESALPDNEEERKLYTRGILRILGIPGRPDIPNTKRHELFISFAEGVEKRETFPILPEAITRFHMMADGRTRARKEEPFLPYEPRGTKRNLHPRDENDNRFRLKHGDLVYFRPSDKGDSVEEISLSSIWRRWAGSTYEHFRKLSKEKLPFNNDRARISTAEQIFGFVEQRQQKQEQVGEGALALAGRVRFSFGIIHPEQEGPYYQERTLLKILDSPKPPQPAFYFKQSSGKSGRIPVGSLTFPQYVPQGRKFYLHRQAQDTIPWRTHHENENLKQKSWVRPINAGHAFYFHIDFDNLSWHELALLCYALRPTEEFRHKIGMGKPLGLGKVRIDPVGLFLVNRNARYRETSLFEAAHYHETWIAACEKLEDWPTIYERERQAAADGLPKTVNSFDDFRRDFREKMNEDIRTALELLGNPLRVKKYPVRTPQVSGKDPEIETYRWFVENKNPENQHQYLLPLIRDSLPELDDQWQPANRRSQR